MTGLCHLPRVRQGPSLTLFMPRTITKATALSLILPSRGARTDPQRKDSFLHVLETRGAGHFTTSYSGQSSLPFSFTQQTHFTSTNNSLLHLIYNPKLTSLRKDEISDSLQFERHPRLTSPWEIRTPIYFTSRR